MKTKIKVKLEDGTYWKFKPEEARQVYESLKEIYEPGSITLATQSNGWTTYTFPKDGVDVPLKFGNIGNDLAKGISS